MKDIKLRNGEGLPRCAGIALGYIGLLLTIYCAQFAGAATTTHLHTKVAGQTRFKNFDFNSLGGSTPASRKVDWAITLLFSNNAEVDKVKGRFKDAGKFQHSGSPQYEKLMDPHSGITTWTSDSDKGLKTYECPRGKETPHFRIYGVRNEQRPHDYDAMYNRIWGHFVIASSHFDHNECGGGTTWYGQSERAEERIADNARGIFGRKHVQEDTIRMYNRMQNNIEGTDHWWWNNGWATKIKVYG